MFFSVQVLADHNIDFDEQLRPEQIDVGQELRQRGPVHAAGRAQLVEEHHGRKGVIQDIRIAGSMSGDLEVLCARCLEPVQRHVERSFDLLYRPRGTDAGVEELTVTDKEAEIGYYDGDGVALEEVVREQVLLAVPIKTLCRDECRGLCPHCGKNLNTESCDCEEKRSDPRWAVLEDIRKQLPKD